MSNRTEPYSNETKAFFLFGKKKYLLLQNITVFLKTFLDQGQGFLLNIDKIIKNSIKQKDKPSIETNIDINRNENNSSNNNNNNDNLYNNNIKSENANSNGLNVESSFLADNSRLYQCIFNNIGLLTEITIFLKAIEEDIIKPLDEFSERYIESYRRLKNQIKSARVDYETACNTYHSSYENYYDICRDIVSTQQKITAEKGFFAKKKKEQFESDLEKLKFECPAAEKEGLEVSTSFYFSKLNFLENVESVFLEWEKIDSDFCDILNRTIQRYCETIKTLANQIIELSKKGRNELTTIRENMLSQYQDENGIKKDEMKQNYGTIPELDFNIFSFLKPEYIFKYELNGKFYMARSNFMSKSANDVSMMKYDLMRVIKDEGNSDGTLIVRNESTMAIGTIKRNILMPLTAGTNTVREICRLSLKNLVNEGAGENDVKKFERLSKEIGKSDEYVLAIGGFGIEETECMTANGKIVMVPNKILEKI